MKNTPRSIDPTTEKISVSEAREILMSPSVKQASEETKNAAIKILMNTHVADNYLKLDDEILVGALSNERPLYKSEWNALISSPCTLKRMQFLANLHARLGWTDTLKANLIHWKLSKNIPQNTSSNYKNLEISERLLGRPLTPSQREYVLDNPNEEVSLGIDELMELEKQCEYPVWKLTPEKVDQHNANVEQCLAFEEHIIPQRFDGYIDHLTRGADFSLTEVVTLIHHWVFLSDESRKVILPILIRRLVGNIYHF